MTRRYDLERNLVELFESEGRFRAPDRVLRSALDATAAVAQRRSWLRRTSRVANVYLSAAAAFVAIAVVAVALALYVGGPSVGGPATPSPTLQSTPAASPSATPGGLALTESFTSSVNGLTVRYPTGWDVQPATKAWTGSLVSQESAFADVIAITHSDNPFIALASLRLAGATLDEWSSTYLSGHTCSAPEPLTVDGRDGRLVSCEEGLYAFATVDDRGYLTWLYGSDDVQWFTQVIATLELDPEEIGGASPSP